MPGIQDTHRTLVSLRMYSSDVYITWDRTPLITEAETIYKVVEDKNSAIVF